MKFTPLKDDLTYDIPLPHRQERFRELIVYIAKKCQLDAACGATKLNKLMWRMDFEYFFRTGSAITGAKYQRLPNGPAPKALVPVRRELISEGAIKIISDEYYGMPQDKIVALREPDTSYFSPGELRFIDEVITAEWGKDATQVSYESHGLAWKTRADKELIPYESAYLSDEPVTEADIIRTKEIVDKYGLPGASA